MNNRKIWACLLLPMWLSSALQAEEMTSHGSHVHGEATLTFVLDGNEAEVALVTAAGNIVGFEHQPKTADEQQKLQQQLQMLQSGDWFVVDAAAGCKVSSHLTTLATGVETIKLQWLIDGEAGAAELSKSNNKLQLR